MIENLQIRESTPADLQAIEALYPDAFPDEDLLPLVRELLGRPRDVISLVGLVGNSLIAHVIFTKGQIDWRGPAVALLGPLAVAAHWQRKGVGSQLVRCGLQRLQSDGIGRVFVLGDPAYYGRFGFAPEVNVAPAYPLPIEWKDAWQSVALGDAVDLTRGTICLPEPWRRKELWGPVD